MRIKKIVIISFVCIVAVAAIYAYSEYNRKAKSLSTATTDFETTDSLLLEELSTREEFFVKKYNDKVMLVTGKIKAVDKNAGQTIISLGSDNDLSSVRCQMDSTQVITDLSQGSQISLKGLFIGFNRDTLTGSDATLNKCVIVKSKTK